MPSRRFSNWTPMWLRVYASIAFGICLLLTFGLMLLLQLPFRWEWLLGCWLLVTNAITFVYFGLDKRRARRGYRRIPEMVLHLLAVSGGSLGAYAGMRFFRHKTAKGTFQIFFWAVVVCQIGLIAVVVYRLMNK